MNDEEREALAGEYVLGTLTAEERGAAKALAASDSAFAGRIADWERSLGALEAMVAPVAPPAALWDQVRARIAEIAPEAKFRLPDSLPAVAPSPAPPSSAAPLRQLRLWRGIALLAIAIAAGLLIAGGVAQYRPDLLPLAQRGLTR